MNDYDVRFGRYFAVCSKLALRQAAGPRSNSGGARPTPDPVFDELDRGLTERADGIARPTWVRSSETPDEDSPTHERGWVSVAA